MRYDVFLRVDSAAEAIRFYVDELGLFKVEADYGMHAYLLCAVGNPSFGLQIAESGAPTSGPARFGLSVECCKREFQRLRQVAFASGGRLVPDANGNLEVFDWPGGQSFLVEDPSGNQMLLFEDYIAPAG